ncbi:hypothetical protein AB1N83_007760 [Pleurotus pulmonarius]
MSCFLGGWAGDWCFLSHPLSNGQLWLSRLIKTSRECSELSNPGSIATRLLLTNSLQVVNMRAQDTCILTKQLASPSILDKYIILPFFCKRSLSTVFIIPDGAGACYRAARCIVQSDE